MFLSDHGNPSDSRKNPSQHRYRLTVQGRWIFSFHLPRNAILSTRRLMTTIRVRHTPNRRSTTGDRRESSPRGRAVASRTQVTRYLRHVTLNFFVDASRLRFHAFLRRHVRDWEVGEEEKEEQVGEGGEGENIKYINPSLFLSNREIKVWNRTAGFQGCSVRTESMKRSLTSPRLGCGFSVRFSLFFLFITLALRSALSLFFPLFFPHVSRLFLSHYVGLVSWSPFTGSLTHSFSSSMGLSFSFLRQGRCCIYGPLRPPIGSRRHWERESEPNLTWPKHPPHHVLPSTPTSSTIYCGSQRRNGGVHRLAGGKYVTDHVHCVNRHQM